MMMTSIILRFRMISRRINKIFEHLSDLLTIAQIKNVLLSFNCSQAKAFISVHMYGLSNMFFPFLLTPDQGCAIRFTNRFVNLTIFQLISANPSRLKFETAISHCITNKVAVFCSTNLVIEQFVSLA